MAMNRTLLEQPFAPAQIKQRKGRNGFLDYVEGWSVIARLNEAFEGAWSFEVTWHEIRETEVLVLGRLTAEGVVKCQFGASQVTRDRETKALLSLGDDLKAASTDALKKCATFLGVGLHLYAERPIRPSASGGPMRAPVAAGLRLPPGGPPDRPPATVAPPMNSGATPERSTSAVPEGAPVPPRGGRATPRQLDAIWKVARGKGLEPGAVEAMSLRVFNRKPDALTQAEAAGLLKELSNMKRAVA
jgi:hypothetical protein